MRRRWLVGYDICHPRRLKRVHKTIQGYGDALQYSVFHCVLSRGELEKLVAELLPVIDATEDSIMIADLGPATSSLGGAIRFVGVNRTVEKPRRLIV